MTSKRLVSLGRKFLFVCALCEIGRQQAMGGQGCYKHSMERSKTLHDDIRKGVQGQKKEGMLVWLNLLWNV
jgi:hypothetical protein